jgi:uncharacterized membrane protein YbhN (UPF0104 family)
MSESPPALRRLLPPVLTTVALAVLALFLARNHRHIAETYAYRPGTIMVMALLFLATLAARGLSHQIIFGSMGFNAHWREWFRLVAVSSFTNYLPFSAGLAVKAFIMKRIYGTPYRIFGVGHLLLLLLALSTNGAVGLVFLAAGFPDRAGGALGAVFAVMAAAAVIIFLPHPLLRRFGGSMLRDTDRLPHAGSLLIGPALLHAGSLLAMAAVLKLSFDMGQEEVGFAACVIVTAASMVVRFLAVTPGAIGIREFLVGGLAVLVGFDLRDAVIAATISRLVEVVVVFSLGGIFTFSLSKRVVIPPGEGGRRT